MRVSIVTAWKDHPELIDDYRTVAAGAEVIIVDNASQPDNAEKLKALVAELGGRYIRNEENKWFAYANNQGFEVATGGLILFLNNDVSGEAIAPYVRNDVKDGGLYGPGLEMRMIHGRALAYIEGWCIAATRKTWKHLVQPGQRGPWDAANYVQPYWEDNDLCFRAVCNEVVMRLAHWRVNHKSNTTSATTPGAYDATNRNAAFFEKRVRDTWSL